MALAPSLIVKVAAVIVVASIVLLKLAAIFWFRGTPTAASAGSVELTTGGVITTVAPVVKYHTTFDTSALPARSRAPVVRVAVYSVLDTRILAGENRAVVPL